MYWTRLDGTQRELHEKDFFYFLQNMIEIFKSTQESTMIWFYVTISNGLLQKNANRVGWGNGTYRGIEKIECGNSSGQ